MLMTIFKIWKVSFGRFALVFFSENAETFWLASLPLALCDSLTSAQIYSALTHDTGAFETEGEDGWARSRTRQLSWSLLNGICNRCLWSYKELLPLFLKSGEVTLSEVYSNWESYKLMATRYTHPDIMFIISGWSILFFSFCFWSRRSSGLWKSQSRKMNLLRSKDFF